MSNPGTLPLGKTLFTLEETAVHAGCSASFLGGWANMENPPLPDGARPEKCGKSWIFKVAQLPLVKAAVEAHRKAKVPDVGDDVLDGFLQQFDSWETTDAALPIRPDSDFGRLVAHLVRKELARREKKAEAAE